MHFPEKKKAPALLVVIDNLEVCARFERPAKGAFPAESPLGDETDLAALPPKKRDDLARLAATSGSQNNTFVLFDHWDLQTAAGELPRSADCSKRSRTPSSPRPGRLNG